MYHCKQTKLSNICVIYGSGSFHIVGIESIIASHFLPRNLYFLNFLLIPTSVSYISNVPVCLLTASLASLAHEPLVAEELILQHQLLVIFSMLDVISNLPYPQTPTAPLQCPMPPYKIFLTFH